MPAERRASSLDGLLDVARPRRPGHPDIRIARGRLEAGLDRGLAVFAEKPLAFTLAEADAIAALLAATPRDASWSAT